MFCGVGPLAVKAAVKRPKLRVLANDLNPEGVAYLKQNIKLNKVSDRVLPFNMDARAFVRMLVQRKPADDLVATKAAIPKEYLKFDHCFMNLPVDAVEFLDVFQGLWNDADSTIWGEAELPLIHVYGFTYERETKGALAFFVERIGKALAYPEFNETHVICFHNIRDVSP